MSALRLLVVEDDESIGEPLVDALQREGFTATWVRTGTEALAADPGDLVLLDLGLPDLDGREVCRQLRATNPVPVIVLTARDDELERVLLLESGADDYVLKPFGFRELVARIRAVHRRSTGATGSRSEAPVEGAPTADLLIDLRAHRVSASGRELVLSPKEFDLLALLAVHAGRAIPRDEIIQQVWDEHWWGPTKTLDVHIASLRRKLGTAGQITTLRGVGYRMEPRTDEAIVRVVDDG